MKSLFKRKPLRSSVVEIEEGQHELKRHLKAIHLTAIGIGAIIGAGIFVITGQGAALYAGPAVVFSFIIAAFICTLAGLCYAELASLIPVAGGSYAYSYIALGELPAWIVGWAVCGQYLISASTVAVGWSGYFISLLKDFGIVLSEVFIKAPFSYQSDAGWQWSGALFNLPAIVLALLLGVLISIGIRAAAHFNNVMVAVKLITVILFIIIGIPYINTDNWIPFIPENTGVFGDFGFSGILRGAGIVFFAYIGFDTVSTLAQDAVHPQKDIPRGVLGSLFICTAAYIIVSLVIVGVVHYTKLNVPDPMAVALQAMGAKFFWFKFIIKMAIIAGLTTVVLVQMLGQSRMFMAMSKDGLLPQAFGKLHKKTKTPVFSSVITTLVVALIAGIFSVEVLAQLVSITSLFIFAIVCLGVLILRKTHPEFHRAFKVPLVPFVPLLGIAACIVQMCMLPLVTWFQIFGWMVLGTLIYFGYSIRHSKVRTSR
ncbi:MAG TPA: amino acid permease [Chlamydiales bacterium]|nr:amino acid permease [Chlamydiales bacterium]